jgi:glucosamine-6-phosphate deaminase
MPPKYFRTAHGANSFSIANPPHFATLNMISGERMRHTRGVESNVEKIFLEKSGDKLKYAPQEKIGVVVVESFPELGTFSALRFLEWTQKNPGGVISLPTGKTPEYFIRETRRYLQNWGKKAVQRELEEKGVDPSQKPDIKSLHFAQIDEFYPMNPLQHNSFYYYVNKYYISGFGFDPKKALLINCSEIGIPDGKTIADVWPGGEIDLTLRYRHPKTALERTQKDVIEKIDEWCIDYEDHIRGLGGIGFFLGGIGPDGHIGFNIRGSDFHSTTRLVPTNYETQAASAQDLGGIEISRKKLVITIGLATIVFNPLCTAIITAAGEVKADIVKNSITSPTKIHFPATALHILENARFYLTKGAAKHLDERRLRVITRDPGHLSGEREKIVVDISLKNKKAIDSLTVSDFQEDPFGRLLLKENTKNIVALKQDVISSLTSKIERGTQVRKDTVFLHTEPHHDDIMLGYLPGVVRHIREHSTRHVFVTFTSGFTAVTNAFMLDQLKLLQEYIEAGRFGRLLKDGYFDPGNITGKNRDVWQYLDGVAAGSSLMKDEGRLRRLFRNLIFLYDEKDVARLKDRIEELINYFQTQYPGRKDLSHIQRLKGMCREWEADCLWGYFGWHSNSVLHLRLGFYTGELFPEEPSPQRDVMPVVDVLRRIRPGIVTVALDPEGSGPDTHYKALQAVTESLKMYGREHDAHRIRIWGYRNVWYRFHPAEANLFIPVSLNMFALQHSAFMNSFLSQKEASFPSHEYDGPFSDLAQKIQVEQYQKLKICLGRSYFYEHESALIRATRGFVFIKEMDIEELYQHTRELQKRTENV